MQTYHYRGLTFDVPDITIGDGIEFMPTHGIYSGSHTNDHRSQRVMDSLNTMWDTTQFKHERMPVQIGGEQDINTFHGIRILDMPIRFPKTNYRLPEIIKPFETAIRNAASYEHDLVNNDNYYCYLTIDQRTIQPGEYTRNEGCHVDGFQGARITTKHLVDHSYIAWSDVSTIFYKQGFDSDHLDEATHNYFKYWDSIALEENECRFPSNSFYLCDSYLVHRTAQLEKTDSPVDRTFIRLSYSLREFDRQGNTHNPMFDYNWDMVPRKAAETLINP